MKEDDILSNGYFYRFPRESYSDLVKLGGKGFEFEWTIVSDINAIKVGYIYEGEVYAMVEFVPQDEQMYNEILLLEVSRNYRNMGLAGKMLAFVAEDSINRGFNGFMLVVSKTSLLSFYVDKMGGERIGNSNRIRFTPLAAKRLIEKYGTN